MAEANLQMSPEGLDGAHTSGCPLAPAVALGHAGHDAQPDRADTYLEEQTKLTRLQIEDMQAENRIRRWSLRVRHVSDVMKLAFELAVAVIFIGIAVIIGGAVWSAAHDNGLAIAAFNVPPDLASRGLTGQVVAAQVQDKLASLQAQTNSMRAASSYENNWGNDIKVQIPETGVSIGEFNDYLHRWLGHETRISGEIFRKPKGIAVTARVGGGEGQTFSGAESDLDALLQKAAEAVYRQTQPYRYGVYLMNHNKNAEAAKVYTALTADPSPRERAWAYIGLANLAQNRGDVAGALRLSEKAVAANPELVLGYINREQYLNNLQHLEESYRTALKLDSIFRDSSESDINPAAVASNRLVNEVQIAQAQGDYLAALDLDRRIENAPDYSGSIDAARENDLLNYVFLHDGAAVRHILASQGGEPNANIRLNRDLNGFGALVLLGDWRNALAARPALDADIARFGPAIRTVADRVIRALTAYAYALKGDFSRAESMIAPTPLDCDTCLRLRAGIADLRHDWAAAVRWSALEAAREPSLPQGFTDWGSALLRKGDLDGAIAKFDIANQKGPHFADPLELWGEALIAKGRSDLALAKFAEAAKYAPNWGRLHLKWGEALLWSGKRDEANKQFSLAPHLDLSPSEKSELAKVREHG